MQQNGTYNRKFYDEDKAYINTQEIDQMKRGLGGLSVGTKIQNNMKSLVAQLFSFSSFYQIVDVLKQCYSTVKDLDSALT